MPEITLAPEVVYVDSGSTDGSVQWARDHRVNTIELEANLPFTAARARNAGFRRLRELKPEVAYVQFLDGDCELIEGWLQHASAFLDTHADVVAVTGQLRERDPNSRSIIGCAMRNGADRRASCAPAAALYLCGAMRSKRWAAIATI